MKKREMIHQLIDKLLDVEESSKKGVNFSYQGSIGIDFHFTTRPQAHSDWIGNRKTCYFKEYYSADEQFNNALKEIEIIKTTPDVEPKVSVLMTEEKAREMGLMA